MPVYMKQILRTTTWRTVSTENNGKVHEGFEGLGGDAGDWGGGSVGTGMHTANLLFMNQLLLLI